MHSTKLFQQHHAWLDVRNGTEQHLQTWWHITFREDDTRAVDDSRAAVEVKGLQVLCVSRR